MYNFIIHKRKHVDKGHDTTYDDRLYNLYVHYKSLYS